MCDSEDKAHYYAEEAAAQHGGRTLVLIVSVQNEKNLRYDGAAMDEPVMADEEARDDAWNYAARKHPEWVSDGMIVIPQDQWEISWHAVGSVWYEGVVPWSQIKTASAVNWYRTAQRKYQRMHDYDPQWDYRADKKPIPEMHDAFEAAKADILADGILKKAKAPFNNFTLFYATNTGGKLGKYVDGTYSEPVVIVNLKANVSACEKYGVDFYIAAKSTILHELKHAMQDAAGEEADELDAEDFAHRNTMQ